MEKFALVIGICLLASIAWLLSDLVRATRAIGMCMLDIKQMLERRT